jgi:hypothetical protein
LGAFGVPSMVLIFGGVDTFPPPLRPFIAFAASPNRSPARFSSGMSAFIAVTSRFTRSAIFDAVFATAPITCGTTHVNPIPRVKTTCSAQLIRWPISSAMMSRTRARTAATTSPAVFTPLEAPSQPFWADSSSVTASCVRCRYESAAGPVHDCRSDFTMSPRSVPMACSSPATFFQVSDWAAISSALPVRPSSACFNGPTCSISHATPAARIAPNGSIAMDRASSAVPTAPIATEAQSPLSMADFRSFALSRMEMPE